MQQQILKPSEARKEDEKPPADQGPGYQKYVQAGRPPRKWTKPGKKESAQSIFRRSGRPPLFQLKDPPPRKPLIRQIPGAKKGLVEKPLLGTSIFPRKKIVTDPPTEKVVIESRLLTQNAKTISEDADILRARRKALLQVDIAELVSRPMKREDSVT